LLQAGDFSAASDDFQQLSDEGKADALRMRHAERRARRSSNAEARRAQAETDRYLLAYFDGLDLVGEGGADKVTIPVDSGPFLDGSRTLREQVRARQKAAQTSIAKDRGVSAQEFSAQIEERLSASGLSADKQKAIKKHVNGAYARYAGDQKNAGIPPPPELVSTWISDWFTVIDRPWYKGGDILRVQQEAKAGAEAPPAAPPAAPAAPPASKARPRRTVGGETREWDGAAWVKVE
jgi:hypothetical protein